MPHRRRRGPGSERRVRRARPSSFLPLLAILVIALTACAEGGSASDAPASAGTPPTASAGSGTAVPQPTVEPTSDETGDPDEATPEPGDDETPDPTDATAAPSAGASDDPAGAAACRGTARNRAFYVDVAKDVAWTVYCPQLPNGWFVDSGRFRLAGGGRLEIGYRGPGDAHITLREGAFCADAGGCVPNGTERGTTAFGDREATLIGADDGSWAIVVDPGASPSWMLVGTGLSEARIRRIGQDLVAVTP